MLNEAVLETQCRVYLEKEKDECQLKDVGKFRKVTGSTGEKLFVVKELDAEKLKADLKVLLERGIKSLAVVLMHAYTYAN